jgi:hypothetical protein
MAISFLLGARDRDRWWRDFDTLAGPSDEWVSAYVACALARSGDPEAMAAARETWRLLERRRWWSAGWGYHSKVPCDADSTLWALELARRVGAGPSWRVRRARALLSRHVNERGGVATYANAGLIRLFTGLGGNVRFDGWCAPHVCVSALAASADLDERQRVLGFVRSSQSDDGSWSAYWWTDAEYSTAFAVRALLDSADVSDHARIERAAAWAAARASFSPFATALRLRVLIAANQPADEGCVSHLLSEQNADGSWRASARLRIPPPDVVHPDSFDRWVEGARGGGAILVDAGRRFTTATVLETLNELEQRHV